MFKNRFFASSRVTDAWDQFRAEQDGYDHVMRNSQPEPPVDFDELQKQIDSVRSSHLGWVPISLQVHPDIAADLSLMQRRLNLSQAEVIQKALELLKVLSTRSTYTVLDEFKVNQTD